MVPRRLENKIGFITGAARGIGRAIARRFVQEGAHLVIVDKDLAGLEKLQEEFLADNKAYQGIYLQADVTKHDEVETAVDKTIERLGRLDILVNNAGTNSFYPLLELPEEAWDAVMNVNIKAVYLVTKSVAKEMVRQKYGKIINLASVLGKKGVKYYAHYCASKFAVIGFTQSTAAELARYGINVNAVCPGEVETDMLWTSYQAIAKYEGITLETQRMRGQNLMILKRFEQPEDIAPLVAFLAADESNYLTGQAINVCGGIHFH